VEKQCVLSGYLYWETNVFFQATCIERLMCSFRLPVLRDQLFFQATCIERPIVLSGYLYWSWETNMFFQATCIERPIVLSGYLYWSWETNVFFQATCIETTSVPSGYHSVYTCKETYNFTWAIIITYKKWYIDIFTFAKHSFKMF